MRDCGRRGAAVDLVLDRAWRTGPSSSSRRLAAATSIFWQSARTAPSGPAQRPRCRRRVPLGDSWRSSSTCTSATRGRSAISKPTTLRCPGPPGTMRSPSTAPHGGGGRAEVTRPISRSTMTSWEAARPARRAATLPAAAVVVEDRYSGVFKLDRVRPAVIAEGLGEAARGSRPFRSCSPRPGRWRRSGRTGSSAPPSPTTTTITPRAIWWTTCHRPGRCLLLPDHAEVRAWARQYGLAVADHGRLHPDVWAAYRARGRGDRDARGARRGADRGLPVRGTRHPARRVGLTSNTSRHER